MGLTGRRALVAAGGLVVLLLHFAGLGVTPLLEPDEARYHEIPRVMVESGDWIIPRINGVVYLQKPPLCHWQGALAIGVLGVGEWAARVPNASYGVLGVGLVVILGGALAGRREGWLAGAILGTSPYWVMLARINITDMTLTFWIAVALTAFWFAHRGSGGWRTRLVWWAGFAAAALGVLAKGLVGALIPAAVAGLYLALTRQWEVLRRVPWLSGSAVFMALAAPWHILASLRDHEFAWYYFVHEHFLRYATPVADRGAPAWFLPAVVVLGLLPWSPILLASARRQPRSPLPPGNFEDSSMISEHPTQVSVKTQVGDHFDDREAAEVQESRPRRSELTANRQRLTAHVPLWLRPHRLGEIGRQLPEGRGEVFLWCWLLFPVAFFSVSQSKLIPYVLPAVPAVALLAALAIGRGLEPGRETPVALRGGLATGAMLSMVVGAALAWAGLGRVPRLGLGGQVWPVLLVVAALVIAGALVVAVAAWRGRLHLAVGAALLGCALLTATSLVLTTRQGDERGSRAVAQEIAARLAPGDLVYSYRDYHEGVSVYLQRRIGVVHHWGELTYGILRLSEVERVEWFPAYQQFRAAWLGPRRIWLSTDRLGLALLPSDGIEPAYVVWQRGNRALLTNHPPEDPVPTPDPSSHTR